MQHPLFTELLVAWSHAGSREVHCEPGGVAQLCCVEIVELRIVDPSTERQVELRMAIMHALEVGIRHL